MPSESVSLGLPPEVAALYRRGMQELNQNGIPILIGGAYAFAQYTEIHRHTKDFDVFLREKDCAPAMKILAAAGFKTELLFPHWLGKAYHGDEYIDLIYGSGNGICPVDEEWFQYATDGTVLGMPAKLVAPEEIIWTKLFIMERERFDGADVVHLIKARGTSLNWPRLLDRVGPHWRVLLAHLILFGFIYPAERTIVPEGVMNVLLSRLAGELNSNDRNLKDNCLGSLLSRAQYLPDIEKLGYRDARLKPTGNMTHNEIEIWTRPIRDAA